MMESKSAESPRASEPTNLQRLLELLPLVALVSAIFYAVGFYMLSAATGDLGVGTFHPTREAVFGYAAAAFLKSGTFPLLGVWYAENQPKDPLHKVLGFLLILFVSSLLGFLANTVYRQESPIDDVMAPLFATNRPLPFALFVLFGFVLAIDVIQRWWLPQLPRMRPISVGLFIAVVLVSFPLDVHRLRPEFGGFTINPVDVQLEGHATSQRAHFVVGNNETAILLVNDSQGPLGQPGTKMSVKRVAWSRIESLRSRLISRCPARHPLAPPLSKGSR